MSTTPHVTHRRPASRPVVRCSRAVAGAVAAVALACSATAAVAEPAPELDQSIDADQRVATGAAELDDGHVDLGPRYLDGAWTLMIHDDAEHDDQGATSVWRHPDETVLRVHDTALLEVPEGDEYTFLGVEGGTPVHVVPQTQDPEVVWLGWNTQDPEVMETIDRGVTLSMIGVEGPGHLVVYLQSGAFEEPDILWDSRITDPQPAWIPVNTHAHANWVFSEPGTYLVHLEVAADLIDGTSVADTRPLRFAVGDGPTVDEVLSATPALTASDGAQAATDTDGTGATDAADRDEGGAGVRWLIAALAVAVVAGGTALAIRAQGARRRAFAARATGAAADAGGAGGAGDDRAPS